MRASVPKILAVAIGGLIASTSAQAAQPEKIDCKGGEVTISGEHRSVELANCAVVRVEGSHNSVAGVLPKKSKVIVTGDGNVLALHPADGVSFSRFKDTGHDNEVHGPG